MKNNIMRRTIRFSFNLKGYKFYGGVRYDDKFYKETIKHHYLEYIEEGAGEYIVDGKSYLFEDGDLFWLKPNQKRQIIPKGKSVKRIFAAYSDEADILMVYSHDKGRVRFDLLGMDNVVADALECFKFKGGNSLMK